MQRQAKKKLHKTTATGLNDLLALMLWKSAVKFVNREKVNHLSKEHWGQERVWPWRWETLPRSTICSSIPAQHSAHTQGLQTSACVRTDGCHLLSHLLSPHFTPAITGSKLPYRLLKIDLCYCRANSQPALGFWQGIITGSWHTVLNLSRNRAQEINVSWSPSTNHTAKPLTLIFLSVSNVVHSWWCIWMRNLLEIAKWVHENRDKLKQRCWIRTSLVWENHLDHAPSIWIIGFESNCERDFS